jgi:hypothetical protein
VIVHHAWRLGAPPSVLKRMIGNIGLVFLLGSIPILGDAFDVVWKANRRNAELIEMFVQGQSSQRCLASHQRVQVSRPASTPHKDFISNSSRASQAVTWLSVMTLPTVSRFFLFIGMPSVDNTQTTNLGI